MTPSPKAKFCECAKDPTIIDLKDYADECGTCGLPFASPVQESKETGGWEKEFDEIVYAYNRAAPKANGKKLLWVDTVFQEKVKAFIAAERTRVAEEQYELGYQEGLSSRANDWSAKLDVNEKAAFDEARKGVAEEQYELGRKRGVLEAGSSIIDFIEKHKTADSGDGEIMFAKFTRKGLTQAAKFTREGLLEAARKLGV